jgi:hypothetical protein
VHPTHVIALAMNEECRAFGHGRVFHLPLAPSRAENVHNGGSVGHPTDLVYVPTPWSDGMKKEWDGGSWEERLRGCYCGESGGSWCAVEVEVVLTLVPSR